MDNKEPRRDAARRTLTALLEIVEGQGTDTDRVAAASVIVDLLETAGPLLNQSRKSGAAPSNPSERKAPEG